VRSDHRGLRDLITTTRGCCRHTWPGVFAVAARASVFVVTK